MASLMSACVADGPATGTVTGGPAPGSFLARGGQDTSADLVFPPEDGSRRARPALGAGPTQGAAHEERPEVLSPLETTDILGGRMRIVFRQAMARPAAKDGANGRVPAAPGTVTITPAVKARVEWADAETLEIVAEEPLAAGQKYTVTLGDVRSEEGAPLATPYKVTAIPRVVVGSKVLSYVPVPGEPRVVAQRPYSGETLGTRPEIAVLYDQPIDLGRARALLSLMAEGGKGVPVSVTHAAGPTFQGVPVDPRFVAVVRPVAPLERGRKHWLSVAAANRGGTPSASLFQVAEALEVTGVVCTYSTDEECSVDGDTLVTKRNEMGFSINNPVSLRARDLVKLVQVSPPVRNLSVEARGWDDGFIEVSGAFEPSRRYEVTLLGLTDRYGSRLAEPYRAVLRRRPEDASVTMASGVLMLDEARMKRFEITSRNVEEAALSFWRVSDDELGATVGEVRAGNVPVGAPSFELKVGVDARENELVTTPVDLSGALESGARFVVTARPRATAFGADRPAGRPGPVALVVAGDAESLAVHVERAAGRTLVHVARMGTGEPVAGAKIALLDTSSAQTSRLPAVSGADGLALLGAEAGGLLSVSAGAASAVVDLGRPDSSVDKMFPGLASGKEDEPSAARAVVFTDRGIYRPGSKVHVFANVRRADGLKLAAVAGSDLVVRALGPGGDEVWRAKVTTSEMGSVSASFELPKGAKLGRHRIVVEPAGDEKATIAQAIVQVAEFEPPRFAVDVSAGATDRATLRADVAARYLFGAPMDGAKVKWTARREAAAIAQGPFEGAGFSFRSGREPWDDRPKAAWSRSGEVVAGADGIARIDQRLSLEGTSGPQRFVVEAEVTDASHRAVAGRASAVVHPAERYAGLRVPRRWAAPGERVPVELAVVDREGKAVIGASVSAALSQVKYTYVARRDAGGAVAYEWARRVSPAGRCTATSAARGVTCDLTMPVDGDYEIAAEVDGKAGGSTTAWAWRGRGGSSGPRTPSKGRAIDLVPDRAAYAPGDTARLFVTSPFEAATAIVTTDAPGKAPRSQRIEGSAGVVEVQVAAEDAPHVHAMVTLLPLSAKGGAAADYRVGAIRLPVAMSGARLALAAAPAKPTYEPGEEARIDLAVTDGGAPVRGAQIAIAVVDEGVLRLTGYHAPDPVSELRPGRALSGEVFDTRAALAELVRQSHVAGDGDDGTPSTGKAGGRRGETDRSLTNARKKFAETAYWNTDVYTDAEGRASVRFKLPDNLTDFRVMAVAIEREGKGAVTETSFNVQKPFLVAAALPRFVSLGDRFEAAAMVHNNTAAAAIVEVTLAGKEKRLLVPGRGHVRVAFPVRVTCDEEDDDELHDDTDDAADREHGGRDRDDATRAGDARDRDDDEHETEDTIHVCPTVKADEERAAVQLGFEARAEGGARLDAVEHRVPATFAGLDERPRVDGAFVKRRAIPLRVPARVAGQGGQDSIVVALGATLWPELGERMRYLLEYPHGCVEQTTSRTLPLLAARDIAPRVGMTEVSDADLRAKIRAGIDRLATMRAPGGGLAYWPGGTEPNVYGTAYAMRAMVLAKAAGIEPPEELVRGMARYLARELTSGGLGPEVRAAIAQSLAELGQLDASSADALFDTHKEQTVFGAASLALALSALPGQQDRVAALLDRVEAEIDEAGELVHPPGTSDFHYYGSPQRTKAQAAIALRRLRPSSRALPPLVRSLSASADSYTTQATAYSLLALAEEVRRLASGAGGARALLDGRELSKARDLPGGGVEYEIPIADVAGKEATLELQSDGEEAVGFVVRAAWRRAADEAASRAFRSANGPSVFRVYTDAKGGPVDLSKVRPGDVLRVAIVVRRPESVAPERFGYVAITDRLPAGFEPVQQDLATVAAQPDIGDAHPLAAWLRSADERASFVELRDDRVNVYFDTATGDDLAASYLVRATTPGRFAIAPATVELMYEAGSFGATEPAEVVIR